MRTSMWHGPVKITATSGRARLLVAAVALLALLGVAVFTAPTLLAAGATVAIVAGALAGAGIVAVAASLAWELVADAHADRVEARWRASLPAPVRAPLALPTGSPVLTPTEVLGDLPWDREPVDLDALGGQA